NQKIMKRLMNKSIVLVSMITTLCFACSKDQNIPNLEPTPEPDPIERPNANNEVPSPTFEVEGYSVAQVTDDLGNQVYQVTFQVLGESDNIGFYSGQFGNDYQYREGEGRLVDYDEINLFFKTRVNSGNQANQFSVHVSTDFNGDYTFDGVTGPEW